MKLRIEEAEGSGHGSTVSPSLLFLKIDEDKHSSVKNWLDQNSDFMDLEKQNLQNIENAEKRKSAIFSNATVSRSRR